jgi:uncharacterized protein
MNLLQLKSSSSIILETISGSKAYGLNTASSDTDIRGIYILPKQALYSLQFEEQISDAKNDTVFYELRKLMNLLLKNNPNILELICAPDDCIIYKHPMMDKLKPELFLSKLALQSFSGYAMAQIHKAHGLNKKILNPMEETRKGLLDFCWVGSAQGSISLKEWLMQNNYSTAQCGCVAIHHMKNCFHLFIGDSYKGITDKDDVQIVLSSVDQHLAPAVLFYCNIEGFQKYCVDYREYWKWVEYRNEARYENTIAHGKNYDAKNMMHTFRLLNMAFEIATEQKINVRRKDRDFLLKIRSGEFEYDDLVQQADEKMNQVKEAFATCDLQDAPDENMINEMLISMREEWYKK